MADQADILGSGPVYLVRTPVSGNWGIPRLSALLSGGTLGIPAPDAQGEVCVVFVTRSLTRLKILHVDDCGVSLTTRILWSRRFRVALSDSSAPLTITRGQLRRLILDGTYEGEWESRFLERRLLECGIDPYGPVPAPALARTA